MLKKIIITLLITLALFLFIGCAQQPAEEPTQLEAPETVDEIDEVEVGIDDIGDIDEELDDSELDDLNTILEDIENI